MKFPDVPTTAEQWQVIAWSVIFLFVVLGSVGMYYSYRAPATAAEAADQARSLSLISWGLAALAYIVRRVLMFVLR